MYLKAEAIHRFLTTENEQLDNLIICKPENLELVSSDQSLYEGLASVEDKKDINLNKLVKLLEVTAIRHFPEVTKLNRSIISHKRAEEIRDASSKKGTLQEAPKQDEDNDDGI